MSKIYALVDVDTGEVGTVAHLNSALHADGDSLSDEIFVKDIDNESDPDSFITAKYWTGSAWADKPEKPGEYYKFVRASVSWVVDTDRLWTDIRGIRDEKLFSCDWAVLPDSPLSESDLTTAKTYRTNLRNIPQTANTATIYSPDDITWPTTPSFLA